MLYNCTYNLRLTLICCSLKSIATNLTTHDDDHVDGVRLRLWPVATNGPIFHHLGDTSIEAHDGIILTGEISRYFHQSFLAIYQQKNLVANRKELGEENYEFSLRKYLCSKIEAIFNTPKNLTCTWLYSLFRISNIQRAYVEVTLLLCLSHAVKLYIWCRMYHFR
jgi:hypothetical protein